MNEQQIFADPPLVEASAVLSDCGRYRYTLERWWDRDFPPAMFVGCNPSTADAELDDPTIRRCIAFAREWGYGGLLMGNLFAFRATDPKLLRACVEPPDICSPVGEVGAWPDREQVNDSCLIHMAEGAGIVVGAWGSIKPPAGFEYRAERVRNMLGPVHALTVTKDGHPGHPLYLKGDLRPCPLPLHVHRWGPWLMREQSLEVSYCETCGAERWD